MPRCSVCDISSDTGHIPKTVTFSKNKKTGEVRCSECEQIIHEVLLEYEEPEDDESTPPEGEGPSPPVGGSRD